MSYIEAFIKSALPVGWSSPAGEIIKYVDVKIDVYPNEAYKSAPRGTESFWFQTAVWMTFFEGSAPRWIYPQKHRLNYYANRIYPPSGTAPTGFELWFPQGIKPSAWVNIEVS